MRIEDLYDLSPREFTNATKGYQLERRETFSVQRLFTTAIVQSGQKKKIDPEKLIVFGWENEGQSKSVGQSRIISGEEAKKAIEEHKKRKLLRK